VCLLLCVFKHREAKPALFFLLLTQQPKQPPPPTTTTRFAGKSTVLRSIAAAALLANCGLLVPAAPGSRVPRLDAFILRTFSGDSPAEALSGFAVEMDEMG
jgi:hypothetical protein